MERGCLPAAVTSRTGGYKLSEATAGRRRSASSIRPDQIDAMNVAFKRACAMMGLTGATPLVELVALRILELDRDGEFDPERLIEATVSTFEG
jgi:hypothetical protein